MDKIKILSDIISQRRTVKPDLYTGERVEDAIIQEVLASANWAPTHGYTEPWRFTVYSNNSLVELGQFMADFNQPNKQAEDFNQIRYDKLSTRPLKASHVIGLAYHPNTNIKIPEIEEICSLAMAVQNMWLACASHNLASYWSTGSMAFSDQFRNFMGYGAEVKPMGLFYIGKSQKPIYEGKRLSPIETKVQWKS